MDWSLLSQFANIAESMIREVNTVEVLEYDVVIVVSVGGWLGFGRGVFGMFNSPPWGGPTKGSEQRGFSPTVFDQHVWKDDLGGRFCIMEWGLRFRSTPI